MTHPSQNALVGRAVAGRFTITRFLGEGGMATVYVAEQQAEPREVALKIMNEELTADRTFVKRFQREAKAAARVQHANSVRIIDYGITDDGLSYIAMELIRGDDLYALLERGGAFTERRAARILAEVCDVLAEAHALGIVHRDLKPENIMVVADPAHPNGERVKVLDFGIAKILEPEVKLPVKPGAPSGPDSGVTRAGTFIGTPSYMSPEQCGLQTVDTRADIYTCGVLLFQLITGRLPFEGQTPLHTASMHIHRDPPKPSEFAPQIDPRLETIILKALAKKPADRFQGARLLAAALRKILPDVGNVAIASGPPSKRQTSIRSSVASEPVSPRAPAPRAPVAPPPPPGSARVVVDKGKRVAFGSTLLGQGIAESRPGRVEARGASPEQEDDEPPTRARPVEGLMPASDGAAPTPRMADDMVRTLVRPDQAAAKRYGPQRTEVIEVGEMPLPEVSDGADFKSTMKSAPIRPAAGMPAPSIADPSSVTEISGIIAPPIPPMMPNPIADPLSISVAPASVAQTLLAPPVPSAPTSAIPLSTLPIMGPIGPATPFVAPTDPRVARPKRRGNMTRGIVIGFLAAVVLMGLLMTGIVLLVGR